MSTVSECRSAATAARSRPIWAALFLAAPLLTALRPGVALAQECPTVEQCISQLRFGEAETLRERAARVLGERGDPSAVPYLSEALKSDPGEFVRLKAAEALGWLHTPQSIPPVTKHSPTVNLLFTSPF